jgi:hypothetical protein
MSQPHLQLDRESQFPQAVDGAQEQRSQVGAAGRIKRQSQCACLFDILAHSPHSVFDLLEHGIDPGGIA